MFLFNFLNNKYLWLTAWALQAIGYYFLMNRLNDIRSYAIIPFFAEWRLSRFVYPRKRFFLRPFAIAAVLILTGFYLNPLRGLGRLLIYAAAIIYYFFLLRLYRRLCAAYKRPWWFMILMGLFPPLFLYLLSRSKENFMGPTFKISRLRTRFVRFVYNFAVFLIGFAEVAAITFGMTILVIRNQRPRLMVDMTLAEVNGKIKDLVADESTIVSNNEALNNEVTVIENAMHSRDYFFPDHSKDDDVVVLTYIIGSNLENAGGLASVNISQMIKASGKGDKLSFVLQTGGSFRWFTPGIEENGNGRYLIKDGKLTMIERLEDTLCMTEPQTLTDFLDFAKREYPADRYMLVLWDHGGGFSLGYGDDKLNRRKDQSTMLVNEMTEAIANSGMKFDLIGFDACLMQNMETALSLEPYADFLLASEESEGGYGWFYTDAFGKLAVDPSLPTLDFARDLIGCYDGYNELVGSGVGKSKSTLSVVDLTMLRPIYEKLEGLYVRSDEAIKEDPEYFADVSISVSRAYTFSNGEQVDLINYLQILDELDYEDRICTDDSCRLIADMTKAAVVYRNRDCAEGINGMSLTFPDHSIVMYDNIYDQFKSFDMTKQMNFYNDFFSIKVATNQKAESKDFMQSAIMKNLTSAKWYVKGFEDYEATNLIIDIPLEETEGGYFINLPEEVKKIIADTRVAVYQKDNDRMRYLGQDHIGLETVDGRDLIGMDDSWIMINNHLISYEPGQTRETEDSIIYTGTTRALLNGKDDIILNIEWEVKDGDERDNMTGKIVGYSFVNEEFSFREKGLQQLQSGDSLAFYFDYYDMEGNLLEKKTYGGSLIITNPDLITVADQRMRNCDITFFGVLEDVYERQFITEKIEYHIN